MKTQEYRAIVESGSTKSDFVVLDKSNEVVLRTQIMGFNPLFSSIEEKTAALDDVIELKKIAQYITQIDFYGAGCSNPALKHKIHSAFITYFPNATCEVFSDIVAACKAVYRGKPCLVGILGTGSNICYYDSNEVQKTTPSLGYVLGDEGSGNHLGKYLLRAYFTHKLPPHLKKKFDNAYDLKIDELLEYVYRSPRANAYLAKFSTFVYDNRDDTFIHDLIQASFEDYFTYQVMPYLHLPFEEINFVGSIAYHYQEHLRSVFENKGYSIGRIVQNPMNELITLRNTTSL